MGGEVAARALEADMEVVAGTSLRHDCRQEDLRRSFEQFGPLKDIYMPRDYYTGDPRGFGFVQFLDPADAKYHMDGYLLLGRELTVVFAEENRKKPIEMRERERGGGRFRDGRRNSSRYYSRSPSYSPPPRRHHSREERYDRERSYSRSPAYNGSRGRSVSPAKVKSRSISRSPRRSISLSPSPRRSRSLSPRRSISRSPRRSSSPRGEQYKDHSPSQ